MIIIWLDILHLTFDIDLRYILDPRLYSKSYSNTIFLFWITYLQVISIEWQFFDGWMGTFDDTYLHNNFIRTMWLMFTVPEAMEWMDCRWNRNRLLSNIYKSDRNELKANRQGFGLYWKLMFFLNWMNNKQMTDLIAFFFLNVIYLSSSKYNTICCTHIHIRFNTVTFFLPIFTTISLTIFCYSVPFTNIYINQFPVLFPFSSFFLSTL